MTSKSRAALAYGATVGRHDVITAAAAQQRLRLRHVAALRSRQQRWQRRRNPRRRAS